MDTRTIDGVAGGTVSYQPTTYGGHQAFVIHWNAVDYYDRLDPEHASLYNTFSLTLVNRADTGDGNFDIVFTYGDLNWTTGDASGGVGGGPDPDASAHEVTPTPARAGYSNGTRVAGTFAELLDAGSGTEGVTGLANTTQSFEIRVPHPATWLTDNASGTLETDLFTMKSPTAILGVTANSGLASLDLEVVSSAGTFAYTIKDNFSVTRSSGTLTINVHQTVNFFGSGLMTVDVTCTSSPGYDRIFSIYVAGFSIIWNGPDMPADAARAAPLSHLQDITEQAIDFFAGQHIQLGVSSDLPAGSFTRGGLTFQPQWSLNGAVGDYVAGYSANLNRGQVLPLVNASLSSQALSFYAVVDAPNRRFDVTWTAFINGQNITFGQYVYFNIKKPGQSIWNGPGEFVVSESSYFKPPVINSPEGITDSPKLQGDAYFETKLPMGYQGQTAFIQLVNAEAQTVGVGIRHPFNTGAEYWLDNRYPYNQHGANENYDDDAPYIELGGFIISASMSFHFKDWLVWTPPSTGGAAVIPVPIQYFTWYTEGSAIWDPAAHDYEAYLQNPATRQTITGTNTNSLPIWYETQRD